MDQLDRFTFSKLTLQKKILSLMVVVMIGLIALTLLIVDFFTRRAMHTALENDLRKTQILFNNYQTIRTNEISTESKLIADIPFLKALISSKEKATLIGFVKSFQERFGNDLLFITDGKGELLATTNPEQSTPNTQNEAPIQNALKGREGGGILTIGNTLYHVTTVPLGLGESILGTLTLGFRIDQRVAEEIKKMTDSEISFIVGDNLIVSTWKGEDQKRVQKLFEGLREKVQSVFNDRRPSLPFDLEMGQGKYISVLVPLTGESHTEGAYLIQRSRDEVTQLLSKIRYTVFLISLMILLIASWISYLISKQISDPITLFTKAMTDGDLSVSVTTKYNDEVGILAKAFNEMALKLRGLITQVREAVLAVTEVTQKLHQSSQDISKEVNRQKAAVEETSSSIAQMTSSIKEVNSNVERLSTSADETSSSIIEMGASIGEVATHMDNLSQAIDITSSSISEMTSNIKETASSIEALQNITEKTVSSLHELNASVQLVEENAQKSSTLSERATQNAQRGMESVHETMAGMQEIKASFVELQETVSRLAAKSESIGKIVQVIAEVAEQTNLLSLNAAIIAAQAGEHGKGFAVVANEIKSLAERTAKSIDEIANLIGAVQEETSNAVKAMFVGSGRVEKGVALSNEAGNVLKVIIESSHISKEMVNEIVKTTKDQGRGIQEVDRATVKIMDMVQQITQATHEQQRASVEIMKAVENMRLLGQEVKRSTQEQGKGSKLITAAVEKVMVMIRHILKATEEQSKGSRQIHHAVEIFKGATEESAQRASEISKVVATLSSRSKQLEQEIGRFKT